MMTTNRKKKRSRSASGSTRDKGLTALLVASVVLITLVATVSLQDLTAKLRSTRSALTQTKCQLEETDQKLYTAQLKILQLAKPPEINNYTDTTVITQLDNSRYIGDFTISFYDLSYESCGKYPDDPGYGLTYSGARVKEGITVAVDPEVIPLGSYIYIEGIGYRVAQDIGGGVDGQIIDVYVDDIQTGYDLGGLQTGIKVYILEEP